MRKGGEEGGGDGVVFSSRPCFDGKNFDLQAFSPLKLTMYSWRQVA